MYTLKQIEEKIDPYLERYSKEGRNFLYFKGEIFELIAITSKYS